MRSVLDELVGDQFPPPAWRTLLESSNYTTSTTQDAGRDPYVDPVVVKGCSGVAALEATEATETKTRTWRP